MPSVSLLMASCKESLFVDGFLSLMRHSYSSRRVRGTIVRSVGLLERMICLCGHVHSGQCFVCVHENVTMCA